MKVERCLQHRGEGLGNGHLVLWNCEVELQVVALALTEIRLPKHVAVPLEDFVCLGFLNPTEHSEYVVALLDTPC